MDPFLLAVFQRQVLVQCEYVVKAWIETNAYYQQRDVQNTFYALQNLLNSAANVSKALWGQKLKPDVAIARKPLRDSIGVLDSSPLAVTRLRSHFEHFR